MSTLLIIRAHPLTQDHSRSMQVTDAFVSAYIQAHPEDTIQDVNLYEAAVPDIDGHLLSAWNALRSGKIFEELSEQQQEKLTLFNGYTDTFLAADKIVIANPLWNLSIPSRLKNWIDAITVSGITFKYNEQGEAVGTVKNKKALHIQANGGTYGGTDPASQYVKLILNFIGITDFQQVFAEGMDHHPEQAAEIVAEAKANAEKIAEIF